MSEWTPSYQPAKSKVIITMEIEAGYTDIVRKIAEMLQADEGITSFQIDVTIEPPKWPDNEITNQASRTAAEGAK